MSRGRIPQTFYPFWQTIYVAQGMSDPDVSNLTKNYKCFSRIVSTFHHSPIRFQYPVSLDSSSNPRHMFVDPFAKVGSDYLRRSCSGVPTYHTSYRYRR